MVKKALCVGCNYPSKAFGLAGSVNDAFLIADTLQKHFTFEPENVCILHDVYPGQKKSMKVDPAKTPTRVNVLSQLQWLVRGATPGDTLFFSFSGYGLQVDDMDGYQDEGYDEAILPTDFVDGRDGDYTVIVTDDIHDILMGIPQGCSVTVLMDCDHATSVIDVSGTLDGKLVEGLKYHNMCGLKAHTAKMQLANHNRDVWQEERARAVKARPRFQPLMEIDNPRKGRLPTRTAMSRSSPVAFCFAAAAHGQTTMEMQMPGQVDGKDAPKQHGILSWCFVQALEELHYNCTYMELLNAIRRQMTTLKEKELPKMDQEVVMTFSTPLSQPTKMKALQPVAGAAGSRSNNSRDSIQVGYPMQQVVPPPPPGFVQSHQPPPQQQYAPAPAPAPGTGGTGAARDPGPGEPWPPLPPPPPPPPPRRNTNELVHHDVRGDRGGSFAVQASYPGGMEPSRAVNSREPSRDIGGGAGYRPPLPASDEAPERSAAMRPPAPPPAPPSSQTPFSYQPPVTHPTPPAPEASWRPPIKGLTPPNLFGGPSNSFSHSLSQSFNQSFGQLQGPGIPRPPMHGQPMMAPQRPPLFGQMGGR